MKITYTKCGDYLLPNLTLPEKENKKLNKYGLLRLEYLKNYKKALYQELLMKDKLIKSDTSITEKLKLENQLLWVQKMNNYKNIAEEVILKEIIYEDEL